MPTLTELREKLESAEKGEIQLLNQIKKERPGYVFYRPFQLFGPATIKLAEGDEFATLMGEAHWTANAREYIQNEEFRYISAEFDRDYYSEKNAKHIGAALLAVGLVNRPFVAGMSPVVLNDDGETSNIDIITTGRWYHYWYGEFEITVDDLEEMVKNVDVCMSHVSPDADAPMTEICIDYNHGSLEYGPENAKAAGWIRGKGIWVQKKSMAASKQTQKQSTAPGNGAIILNSPTPQGPEKQKGHKMDDVKVREVLGLSEGAEVTDEQRNEAFELLYANSQTLSAIVGEVGEDIDPAQVPVILKEGTLPGRVILTVADHERLTAAEVELTALKAATDTPKPVGDNVVLSQAKLTELEEGAKAGKKAEGELHVMRVNAFMDANKLKIAPAERERVRARLTADFENVSEDIKARPNLNAQLFAVAGSGNEPEGGNDGEKVKAFLAKREEELKAQKLSADQAYSQAWTEAKQKFTAQEIKAYEYPDLKTG